MLYLTGVASLTGTLKSLHMLEEDHMLSALPRQSEGSSATRGLDSGDDAMTYLRAGVVIQLKVLQAAELAEGGQGKVAVELIVAHVHP